MAVPIPEIHTPHSDPQVQKVVEATKKNNLSSADKFTDGEAASIARHIKLILEECKVQAVKDKNQIAFILAAVRQQSKMGVTLIEKITEEEANKKYSSYNGNSEDGDGFLFKGRGYIMLKGRSAYQKMGDELGEDLLSDPEKASEPELAAQICVVGIKEGLFYGNGKLSDFVSGTKKDFSKAWNLVCPEDAKKSPAINTNIAKYSESYAKVL